jgi:hypothetical protein
MGWTFDGLSIEDITGEDLPNITAAELAEDMADYAYQYEYNRAVEIGDNTDLDRLDSLNFLEIAENFLRGL